MSEALALEASSSLPYSRSFFCTYCIAFCAAPLLISNVEV